MSDNRPDSVVSGGPYAGDEREKYEAEIDDLRRQLTQANAELAEATRAGTPYWKERDAQNALVLENERLQEKLAEIKRAWQSGIGDLDSPWRVKMAELVGDEEGLAEAARKKP